MVPTLRVEAGHAFYHGTNEEFDERSEPLRPASWVGYPLDEASVYVDRGGGRNPRVIRYETARPLELVRLRPARGVRIPDQVALAHASGFDGVYLDYREPDGKGLVLVLAAPGDVLVHDRTHGVGARPDPMADLCDPAWDLRIARMGEAFARCENDPPLPPAGTMDIGVAAADPVGPGLAR